MKSSFLFAVILGASSCIYAESSVVKESGTKLNQVDFSRLIRFKVHKFQLKNGLKVLIHEDHRTPSVSVHHWYKVGSKDEIPGRTGLAHFFEHLMFRGSQKFPAGVMDKTIEANGGSTNAFTTRDYTGYYINVPSDKLSLVLDIESDRMRNLIFNKKLIQKEREVVKEERRYRVQNNIFGFLNELVFKTVYKVSSYRWPVIGYMKDLNSASMSDFQAFYNQYYVPNNAVLVISGDVNTSRAESLVRKYYDSLKAVPLMKKNSVEEPLQKGQRELVVQRHTPNPVVAIVYQNSSAYKSDAYAMDFIASILTGGRSSRLYNKMVYRQQSVLSVNAGSWTPMLTGTFKIVANIKSGVDIDQVTKTLFREMYKLRTHGVKVEELEKVRSQLMSQFVGGLKTIEGKASSLAINEIYHNDYRRLFQDLERYKVVTVEDVQRVARQYLKPTQASVIKILPKKDSVNE